MSLASKIICKTAGISVLGLVGYDAYHRGKWQGRSDFINTSADHMAQIHMNCQRLGTNSATGSKIKRFADRHFVQHGDVFSFFSGVKGFCSGIMSSITDNVVPFSLALGALLLKRGSKLCTIGLGLYAAKYLVYDILGKGKPTYFPEKV